MRDEKERDTGKTRYFVALAAVGVLIGLVFALVMGKPEPKAVPQPVAQVVAAQGQGQVEASPGAPIAVVMADGTVVVRDWAALGRLLADNQGLAEAIKRGQTVGSQLVSVPGAQRVIEWLR